MKKLLYCLLACVSFTFAGCMGGYNILDGLKVGPQKNISVPAGCSGFARFFPDGKLSLVKKGDKWQMFWGERCDFLTEASTPWPEDHYSKVVDSNIVFGEGKSSVTELNENGSWFIGVYPLDDAGNYVGFFHGESWWTKDTNSPNYGVAHKSIGVAYSEDYGKTWKDAQPIIIDKEPKPANPDWTGLGDGCVIWDDKNNRWICYYQGRALFGNGICMAVSYDRRGSSGTWKKWDGHDFTLEGYRENIRRGDGNFFVSGLSSVLGANPSVMWNDYIGKYIMAYHSWGGKIFISSSEDGISWATPREVTDGMYPNLISVDGDTRGGKSIRMYYAANMKNDGSRTLAYRDIIFD